MRGILRTRQHLYKRCSLLRLAFHRDEPKISPQSEEWSWCREIEPKGIRRPHRSDNAGDATSFRESNAAACFFAAQVGIVNGRQQRTENSGNARRIDDVHLGSRMAPDKHTGEMIDLNVSFLRTGNYSVTCGATNVSGLAEGSRNPGTNFRNITNTASQQSETLILS